MTLTYFIIKIEKVQIGEQIINSLIIILDLYQERKVRRRAWNKN